MFVDLEKVFDRVPRVLIESSLRRKGVVECYVNAMMKMYQKVLSQVKVEGEDSKEFAVRVVCVPSSHMLRRPVKEWIDVVEEDMKKWRVVQQDAGDYAAAFLHWVSYFRLFETHTLKSLSTSDSSTSQRLLSFSK